MAWPRSTATPLLLTALAVAAAYAGGLRGAFVLDDRHIVSENPTITNLRRLDRVLCPPADGSPVDGRPVANLSLAINYAIGSQRVGGYHAFNIAIHLLNCWLMFGLTRRALRLPGIHPALASRAGAVALAAALLWAVHPLAASAVDYVSQRTELLATLFYLATLYAVLRQTEGRRPVIWGIAAIAACTLGMASKEVMVTAPVVALLMDRILVGGTWAEWRRRRGWVYAGLAMSWGLLAGLVARSGTRDQTAGWGAGADVWRYALTQAQAICIYLKLQLWPHPLVFDYGPGLVGGVRQVWPDLALVVTLLGAAGWAAWRWPRAGLLAMAWFLVLAPSSSVVPIRSQTIGEHRAYLPLGIALVGISCAVAVVAARLPKPAVVASLVLVCAGLGLMTERRHAAFRTEVGLWEDVLAKRPQNSRAYNVLAEMKLLPRREYDRAMDFYARAIAADPDSFEAYSNRASLFMTLGAPARALADANEALRLRPDVAFNYVVRAAAYDGLGDYRRAIDDCDAALRRSPANHLAYYARGNAYRRNGQLDAGIADLGEAIRLRPNAAAAYVDRGVAYYAARRFDLALADWTRAAELSPHDPAIIDNRGAALAALGRRAEAIAEYERAIAMRPDFANPYINLASLHAQMGELDQAWADVRAARARGAEPPAEFVNALKAATGRSE